MPQLMVTESPWTAERAVLPHRTVEGGWVLPLQLALRRRVRYLALRIPHRTVDAGAAAPQGIRYVGGSPGLFGAFWEWSRP